MPFPTIQFARYGLIPFHFKGHVLSTCPAGGPVSYAGLRSPDEWGTQGAVGTDMYQSWSPFSPTTHHSPVGLYQRMAFEHEEGI